MKVKAWHVTLGLILLAGILAGCGTAASPSIDGATSGTETSTTSAQSEGSIASIGEALDDSYEGALPVSNQLAVGTFKLEGTANAVTTEQAQALLPLWQIIESGTLRSETETGAIVSQIEGAMTPDQLAVIAAMQLTIEDMGAWAREQGLNLGSSPEAMAVDRAAGGGKGGQGANLSEEERAAARATAQAGGTAPGGRQAGAGAGQLGTLSKPLVDMLTMRATE